MLYSVTVIVHTDDSYILCGMCRSCVHPLFTWILCRCTRCTPKLDCQKSDFDEPHKWPWCRSAINVYSNNFVFKLKYTKSTVHYIQKLLTVRYVTLGTILRVKVAAQVQPPSKRNLPGLNRSMCICAFSPLLQRVLIFALIHFLIAQRRRQYIVGLVSGA
jgi:hypothetical protein